MSSEKSWWPGYEQIDHAAAALRLGYEVEIVNPQAAGDIADWTLPNMLNTDDLFTFENRATLYWQVSNIVKRELLTVSPVHITRIL